MYILEGEEIVVVNGSFANNQDLMSQLGFIIAIRNEEYRADEGVFTLTGNIIHRNSSKCKQVTRSVLASELCGLHRLLRVWSCNEHTRKQSQFRAPASDIICFALDRRAAPRT